MSPGAPHIPCDKCGRREATWVCTNCQGLFCPDDVLFEPKSDKHPWGQVLCLNCYPVHHVEGSTLKLKGRA